MKRTSPAYLAGLLLLPLACAKTSEDTASPIAAQPAEPADVQEYPDKDPDKAGIVIGPKIAAMCDIPTTNFEFDSSSLSPEAQQALDALGKCFTDGPAAGEAMRLVGHADPRGTEEYNLALGQRRAGGVAGYIEGTGLEEAKMETSSRGELDARGEDEASWAADRKVEIFLAQ